MVNYEQSENKIKPTGDHSFKMVGQSKTIRVETQATKQLAPRIRLNNSGESNEMLNHFIVEMLLVSSSAFQVSFPIPSPGRSFLHILKVNSLFSLFIIATGEAKLVQDNAICVHMENSAPSIFVFPVPLEVARCFQLGDAEL